MSVALVLIGIAAVGIVLRDVVHELFHPAAAGTLSRALRRVTWRLFRRLAARDHGRLAFAGPATLLVVISAWLFLSVVGWALVFLSFMPGSFQYVASLDPGANADFGTAIYLSLTALATLGFGDLTPISLPLRLAVTAEGLLGFLMLTAGISWALAIKPVIAERRALAALIHALLDAERKTSTPVSTLPPEDLRPLLVSFSEQVVLARSRLLQSPETYYFHSLSPASSLPAALPRLLEIAQGLERRAEPGVRLHAATLRESLAGFAGVLARQFGGGPRSTAEMLAWYAEDHLQLQEARDARSS